MHDTDAVSDFAKRFVRCIRMLRKLTLVNHYYMPYTELMRERITHLSSAFRVCAGVRLQKSCNRMLDRSSRARQNSPLLRFSASPLLRFSASPLLRFSASPLRVFSAHPPHTDRPHIMGTQYTHRTVRTKDIPSPCVFLFFYQKITIKIADWKTFFMEKTHADFSIARFGNRAFRIYLPAFIRRVLRAAS
ncbi:hypothetical protein HMPREF1221_00847 [Treponema socranskii subsp. paredis ATCC 35535]|nr:hypothetical protein HMPREF1221_00847 [Treponema socranskii subsp. paredis ATCC 35535]